MGDKLASSSEGEKSRVGRKGPRRSDDDPAAAEALRDDMTIAGSVVGSQSEAGDALTAEAEPAAAATEPPANPTEPTEPAEPAPKASTEAAMSKSAEGSGGSGEENLKSKVWKVVKSSAKQPDHPPPGHLAGQVPGPKTPPVPPPKTAPKTPPARPPPKTPPVSPPTSRQVGRFISSPGRIPMVAKDGLSRNPFNPRVMERSLRVKKRAYALFGPQAGASARFGR